MNTKSIQGKRIGRLILGWIGTVIGGLFTLAGILSAFACSEGCDGNLQSVFTGLTVFFMGCGIPSLLLGILLLRKKKTPATDLDELDNPQVEVKIWPFNKHRG